MPRTHVLDGLEGALDVDRMGLAPEGSTLAVAEASPALFRQHYDRLRLANVRWVMSFHSLPEDLVSLRDEIRFGEVRGGATPARAAGPAAARLLRSEPRWRSARRLGEGGGDGRCPGRLRGGRSPHRRAQGHDAPGVPRGPRRSPPGLEGRGSVGSCPASGRLRAVPGHPDTGRGRRRDAPIPARLACARVVPARDGGVAALVLALRGRPPSVSHFTKPPACAVLF